MNNALIALLGRLNLPYKARFTIEETADILGIRRDQVISQLKKKTLIGTRCSIRRWGGVFADDLNTYLERIQAPSNLIPQGEEHLAVSPELGEILPALDGEDSVPPRMPEEPTHTLTVSEFAHLALRESGRWDALDLANAMTEKIGKKVWSYELMDWERDREIPEEMRMPFASVLRDKGWDIESFSIVPDPGETSEVDLLDC